MLLFGLFACDASQGAVPGQSAAPTGAAALPGTPGPTERPSTELPADPRVAVLGDSYTVGVGASGPGYVDGLAAQTGWTVVGDGESGTGYVNVGEEPGASVYGDRVADVVAEAPDLVIVQGSTNDLGRTPVEVGRAASAVYAALAAGLPDAVVVVVGPLAPPAVDAVAVAALRDALVDASGRAGLLFIDPLAAGWLQPPDGFFIADGLHPSDAGHQRLADELVAALRRLGL